MNLNVKVHTKEFNSSLLIPIRPEDKLAIYSVYLINQLCPNKKFSKNILKNRKMFGET